MTERPKGSFTRREVLGGFLGAGLSLPLLPAVLLTGCGRRRGRPSVILITVDTLRADHLGCYGYGRPTSPAIDAFAAEGLLFENCFANAPSTRPSFAGILSGYLPHETKIQENRRLVKGFDLLPEILKREGYGTLAVVSNFVLMTSEGWDRGFDIYDHMLRRPGPSRPWPERTAEDTTDRAIELIDRFGGKEFFAWIHYQDPHGPYTPPPSAQVFSDPSRPPRPIRLNDTLSGRGGLPSYQRIGDENDFFFYFDRYDGEILHADRAVGRLLDALKRMGLYEDSLIIFSSDHGESLGEGGDYFCHSESLHQSLLHVPLVIRWGDRFAGRREDHVQHLDIVPTILDAAGAEADVRMRGGSLLVGPTGERWIFGEMRLPRGWGGTRRSLSVIAGSRKLVHTPRNGAFRLYDIVSDPNEEEDLLAGGPMTAEASDLAARLKAAAEEDRLGLPVLETPRRISPAERERLRALGYME